MVLTKTNILKSLLMIIMSAFMLSAHAGDLVYKSKSWPAALGGYDTVSYFTESGPVEGSSEFSTTYLGQEWFFANQANLDAFVADPDAYRPQYGGYCAWAMAKGQKAPGKPTYFDIVDGKLYLNFNKGIQKKWRKDIPGFIEKADPQWAKLVNGS